jgi:hypothetical protein
VVAAVNGEPVDPVLRDRVERACLLTLAGPVAEARADKHGLFTVEPPPDPAGPVARTRYLAAINSGEPRSQSDLEFVDGLLRRITPSEGEAEAYRTVLIERTYTVAARHPRFWPLAEAFARELLIRDELDGAQVAAIVAEVCGEEPHVPEALSA